MVPTADEKQCCLAKAKEPRGGGTPARELPPINIAMMTILSFFLYYKYFSLVHDPNRVESYSAVSYFE